MEERTNNLYRELGKLESRVCNLEQQSSSSASRVEDAINKVDVLAESFRASQKENDERWNTVLEKLKIVEDIQEIKTTLQTAGRLVSGLAKGIKWIAGLAVIIGAAVAAWKAGDVPGLLQAAGMLWGN